jgi:hypothetical protein
VTVDIAGADEHVGGDVGHVFVRLFDPISGAGVVETETDATRGYAVALGAIPAGRYRIAAGTDRDGDGEIGDAGEAFGSANVEVAAGGLATVELPILERAE